MRNQIKLFLLVSLVITITACGRMGDLVPITESQVGSIEATTSS